MDKINKYNYVRVIQGCYAPGYGWEDVSEYEDNLQGRKDAWHDKSIEPAAPIRFA